MPGRIWLIGGVVLLVMACQRTVSSAPATEPAPGDQFAADRDVAWPFDQARAARYLKEICDLGPRVSGSPGMKRQQDLLKDHFEKLGAQVSFQKFTARQVSTPQPVEMANMVVSWRPQAVKRILFCAHYDTRPIADQEPRREDWTKPFVGANDGASAAAFLMELGHTAKDAKLNVGLDFVFFDGEEYIFEKDRDRYFFGSDYFADQYTEARPGDPVYLGAILLDLFAGTNARLPKEPNSKFLAGYLVEDVWRVAARLKVGTFAQEEGPTPVTDDHLGLNRVGIPAVDVIDFTYPHWHRLSDLPENVSTAVMADVAKVLTVWASGVK